MSEDYPQYNIGGIITPAQAVPAPEPVRLTAHDALVAALAGWAEEYDLPFDEGDLIIDNDGDGDLRIVLPNLTLNNDGDIVVKQREYRWTGTVTITVDVSGTVTASDEDEAHDLATEALDSISVDGVDIDSWGGEFEVDAYYTDGSEVGRVHEV